MLILTDNAVKRFKEILIEKNGNGHGVRIFTTSGG